MGRLRPYLAALLITLTVTGCATKLPTRKTGDTGTPTPEIVSLRVFSSPGDTALDALISAFYKQESNIRIEKVTYQSSGQTVNLTEILQDKLKNREIDLFPPAGNLQYLVDTGMVLSLDPLITKSQLDLKPVATLAESARVEGRLYTLPIHGFPTALYYNADLFTAAGIPLPKPGWTWDEFRAAAARLTTGAGDSKVWGISTDIGLGTLAMSMIDEKAGVQSFDPQSARETLQFWSTMIDSDQSARPNPKPGADGRPMYTPRTDFRDGKAAMTLTSLNMYQWEAREWKFKWDVAPMPVSRSGKAWISVYPNSYAIAASTPYPDAAWKFLQFMFSEEGAVTIAKAAQQLPLVRTEAVRQAWFARTPAPPPGSDFYFEAEIQSQAPSTDLKTMRLRSSLLMALQPVLQGGADIEAQYRTFVAEREKILSGQ